MGTSLRRTTLVLGALLLPFVLAACGDSGGSGASDEGASDTAGSGDAAVVKWAELEGRTFATSDPAGLESPRTTFAGGTITIRFDATSIVASGGCNTISGQASLESGRLQVARLSGTEMGCDSGLMAQDDWLSKFLASKPMLSLTGDHELALVADDQRLTLSDGPAPAATALEGTTWLLEAVLTGDAATSSASSVSDGVDLVLDGGRLSAHTGCNRASGSATISDDTIETGPLATTKMACSARAMKLERQVLQVLESSPTYEIDGDRLTRRSPDGLGLQFTAAT